MGPPRLSNCLIFEGAHGIRAYRAHDIRAHMAHGIKSYRAHGIKADMAHMPADKLTSWSLRDWIVHFMVCYYYSGNDVMALIAVA